MAASQWCLASIASPRHRWPMHRRLVFEEPVSRAALWSRRLAWFALAVLLLALLVFRSGEPTLEGLAPVAAAYGVALIALCLSLLAFARIWQTGHRGVGMAAGAFLMGVLMLVPAAYVVFKLVTLPALADISTDIDDPPAFSRSRADFSRPATLPAGISIIPSGRSCVRADAQAIEALAGEISLRQCG